MSTEDKEGMVIGGRVFHSRLLMGTGIYRDHAVMAAAIERARIDCVTVAMGRLPLEHGQALLEDSVLAHIPPHCLILPNTAGAYTVEQALHVSHLSRELLGHPFVKLEVLGSRETLFPDMAQTVEALKVLVSEGYHVMVYCSDDPIYAASCQEAGAAAIMPLGSLIGSGRGILNPLRMQLIRRVVTDCPLIIDAGVGEASHAAQAMEIGADGVLINTAIARAKEPVLMAEAMHYAVKAGRLGYLAGSMVRSREETYLAVPTSPTTPL